LYNYAYVYPYSFRRKLSSDGLCCFLQSHGSRENLQKEEQNMNISLKQLEVFVTIVECGNFTEAGRKLYLAQSTVSSHITALEETLRVSLFRRESKRTIELTADGKRVYQYAKDVVAKCLVLEEAVALEERRELVIGASTVPSKSLLPEKMMQFQRSHPECCCVVRGGDSEQIQQMVLDGDVQLGFVGSTDNRQQLCYERIARDRLVLITPNTPRFARLKERGTLGKDLLSEPLIFRDRGSGTQKMIDNYLSSREDFTPDVRFYAADPEMIQSLVSQGAGISILSALGVEERVKSGELLSFELDEIPVYRNIYMVYQRKGTLSELAKAFVALMRTGITE
jgi:DNA-binding transcriptional LysR family regulator